MRIIETAALRHPASEPFTEFEGRQFGAGASFILVQTDEPGVGPELHQHPYAETFVIRSGRPRFTVGSEQVVGVAGQIIVVPAGTLHRFAMIGPEPLEMIDIYASDMFITTWQTGRAKVNFRIGRPSRSRAGWPSA